MHADRTESPVVANFNGILNDEPEHENHYASRRERVPTTRRQRSRHKR